MVPPPPPHPRLHLNAKTGGDRSPHKGRHSSVRVRRGRPLLWRRSRSSSRQQDERETLSWRLMEKKKKNMNCSGWIELSEHQHVLCIEFWRASVWGQHTSVFWAQPSSLIKGKQCSCSSCGFWVAYSFWIRAKSTTILYTEVINYRLLTVELPTKTGRELKTHAGRA